MLIYVDFQIIENKDKIDFGIKNMEIKSDVALTDNQVEYYKNLAVKRMTDRFEKIVEKYYNNGDTHRLTMKVSHHYSFDGVNPVKKWEVFL